MDETEFLALLKQRTGPVVENLELESDRYFFPVHLIGNNCKSEEVVKNCLKQLQKNSNLDNGLDKISSIYEIKSVWYF